MNNNIVIKEMLCYSNKFEVCIQFYNIIYLTYFHLKLVAYTIQPLVTNCISIVELHISSLDRTVFGVITAA